MSAIIFDLDDTLYKEREYVNSGCRAVAEVLSKQFNIPSARILQIIDSQENVAIGFDCLITYVNSLNGPSVSIDDILNIYRNHEPTLRLPQDSREVLETFLSQGEFLGIITDGRSFAQRAKIRALGLEKYFSSQNIIISEEIGADKHSPAPFIEMTKLYEATDRQPSRLYYIADNPRKDFLWPNRLGWQTIQLLDRNGVNIKSPIEAVGDYRPKFKIDSLPELIKLIDQTV